MKLKRMARDAVLTAVALTIFVLELQLPDLIPVPGVKAGLSNIVTLITLYLMGPWDALAVLTARILLGSVFSGNASALIYSLAGSLAAFPVTLLMKKIVTERQVWVASVFAAIAHNAGQMGAAILVTATLSLAVYLPVLTVSGVIAGFFTGLAAQACLPGLSKILRDQ